MNSLNSHDTRQHRRIVVLTLALCALTTVSIWQQLPSDFFWQENLRFEIGSTSFTLSVAFFLVMVAAVNFTRNSSRELREVAALAFIDELTGMANRRQFMERLGQELSRAARLSHGVSVMYFDLDRFKEINDCYGHDVGDQTIKEFGRRLQSVLRAEDFAARLGGDEFAAVISNVDSVDTSVRIADRILTLMREPFEFDNTKLYVTVSIGASITRDGSLDATNAVRQADFALLQAKEVGRNCVKVFDPNMAKQITAKRKLESDMRDALLNGGFHVEYQPFLAQGSHQIVGAEALLRWVHPTKGPISPETFIPIAEKTGLIHELGEFVLMKACQDFSSFPNMKVAVNVSPIQFQHGDFIDKIQHVLSVTRFNPERLEIEITEGIFINDPAKASKIIQQIRNLDVSVALDDFGTGYSSMSYLQDFKIDRIKIDRSFVSKMDGSIESEKLVSTMIEMGTSLGLAVTVEGIETNGQLQKLRKYNCTELQGFLFSKSVEISQFERLCVENIRNDTQTDEGNKIVRLAYAS